jgi:hypothetical protein
MNEGEAVVHGPGDVEEVPHRGRAHDGFLGWGIRILTAPARSGRVTF